MASSVRLHDVSKSFGAVAAVDRVQLVAEAGELLSILGPSGCGKTTTLRLIAGLDRPDSGTIHIGDRDVTALDAADRPVATVFQSYALFPHLDVARNIAYGFRWRREVRRAEVDDRVRRVMQLVRIDGLERRRPSELSGGQRQRVALARSIVLEPEVLLLDEPLSAVDALLRAELRDELRTLQRALAMTFVYVTHDRDEAFVLSDRIAVMSAGRVVQTGSPRELYERPATPMVAELMGTANLLDGESDAAGNVRIGPFALSVGSNEHPVGPCVVTIRPEHLDISASDPVAPPGPADPSSRFAPGTLHGQVVRVSYLGATTEVIVRLRHGPTIVTVPRHGDWTDGASVWVRVDPGAVRVLPAR